MPFIIAIQDLDVVVRKTEPHGLYDEHKPFVGLKQCSVQRCEPCHENMLLKCHTVEMRTEMRQHRLRCPQQPRPVLALQSNRNVMSRFHNQSVFYILDQRSGPDFLEPPVRLPNPPQNYCFFYELRGHKSPLFQVFFKTRPICLHDKSNTPAVTRLGARKPRLRDWL